VKSPFHTSLSGAERLQYGHETGGEKEEGVETAPSRLVDYLLNIQLSI